MVKNLPTVERSTKIRFGKHALENQAENTVVFNASDTPLQATNPSAVYLSPIRFRQDFSDPEIVLLMYNKTTGEITESGSSASSAIEPPLQSVTSYGNTTNRIIQFTNPTTAFTTSGNVHVNGDLEVQGNINFHNGTITEIKNTDLVVEDRIIGIAHNNTQVGLDTGIIIHYPNQNVGIIHHGDETPKRLSIGYTQNGSTDTSITADANNITLDVLGDCTVQNDLTVNGAFTVNSVSVTSLTATGTVSGGAGTFTGAVSGTTGTFSGAVSGTTGTFTGAVSGTSFSDGTATLTGGAWSGSAATLTTSRTIGGVSFNGSANIDLPGVNTTGTVDTTGSAATLTTPRAIGGVDFDGSAAITLPGVNAPGTESTSGSAATLTTARLIGGVSFNGSADIILPGVNAPGTESTTGSAATLTTPRAIGGVDFDGSAAITLPGVNAPGNRRARRAPRRRLTTTRTDRRCGLQRLGRYSSNDFQWEYLGSRRNVHGGCDRCELQRWDGRGYERFFHGFRGGWSAHHGQCADQRCDHRDRFDNRRRWRFVQSHGGEYHQRDRARDQHHRQLRDRRHRGRRDRRDWDRRRRLDPVRRRGP